MTERELVERRKGLQSLLQRIVVRNDLMNSEKVKAFLELDTNASEVMVNPPTLELQYAIEGANRGVTDFVLVQEEHTFYLTTSETSTMSKLNAKMTNTKMPWENESAAKTFVEIGSVEAWACEDDSSKFIKVWSKGYPTETSMLFYDKASNKVLIGLDDGVIDVLHITTKGYEDVACFKAHQNRVTGMVYDALSNVIYSVSLDRTLRVSHGTSIALILSVPHK
jgi:WD40 repeat protein